MTLNWWALDGSEWSGTLSNCSRSGKEPHMYTEKIGYLVLSATLDA